MSTAVSPQRATGLINLKFVLYSYRHSSIPSGLPLQVCKNNALGFLVLFLCAVVKVRAGYEVRLSIQKDTENDTDARSDFHEQLIPSLVACESCSQDLPDFRPFCHP